MITRIVKAVTVFLLLGVISLPGGLLNRIRGGWQPISEETYGYWGAHFYSRLVFAGPYAVWTLILGIFLARAFVQNKVEGTRVGLTYSRAFGLTVAVFVVTLVSLFVGWGTYFSLGTDTGNPDGQRTGCFDWLLGRRQADWSFWRRWSRDWVGMSLRGLMWTAPSGVVFLFSGFGWLPLCCGVLMGSVYSVSEYIPVEMNNFQQGTALAELLWGILLFQLMLISFLRSTKSTSLEAAQRKMQVHASHSAASAADGAGAGSAPLASPVTPLLPTTRCGWATMHVSLLTMALLFLASGIFYAWTKQDDMRNFWQTELGSMGSAMLMLALHAYMVSQYGVFGQKEIARNNDVARDKFLPDFSAEMEEEDARVTSITALIAPERPPPSMWTDSGRPILPAGQCTAAWTDLIATVRDIRRATEALVFASMALLLVLAVYVGVSNAGSARFQPDS